MSMYHPNRHEIASVRKAHEAHAKSFEIDAAIERAIVDEHKWDRRDGDPVRVHDWREHVGDATRREWHGMNFSTRVAIALDAETRAGTEEWE